jgi:hypothetical protein
MSNEESGEKDLGLLMEQRIQGEIPDPNWTVVTAPAPDTDEINTPAFPAVNGVDLKSLPVGSQIFLQGGNHLGAVYILEKVPDERVRVWLYNSPFTPDQALEDSVDSIVMHKRGRGYAPGILVKRNDFEARIPFFESDGLGRLSKPPHSAFWQSSVYGLYVKRPPTPHPTPK